MLRLPEKWKAGEYMVKYVAYKVSHISPCEHDVFNSFCLAWRRRFHGNEAQPTVLCRPMVLCCLALLYLLLQSIWLDAIFIHSGTAYCLAGIIQVHLQTRRNTGMQSVISCPYGACMAKAQEIWYLQNHCWKITIDDDSLYGRKKSYSQ